MAATVPPYSRIRARDLRTGDRLVSGGVIATTGRASLASVAVDVELEDEPGMIAPRVYPDDLTILVHEPRPAPFDDDRTAAVFAEVGF
jgi:hypothetical protein